MDRKEIFEQVLRQVDWIKEVSKRRGWDLTQDLVLEGPATEEEIRRVEQELGMEIPEDYKDLFRFSRRLEFRYEYDEEMPAGFENNYSGEINWNLSLLKEQREELREWVEVVSAVPARSYPATVVETKQVWADKLPLVEVANGDLIVVGGSPSEVVYFSCQEYAMHGRKLSSSLWEFLEFHSRVGFAGGEDWQLEPFFDMEPGGVRVKGESVDRFVEWLKQCDALEQRVGDAKEMDA
jgi:cell wall assembly regulator SMI1